MKRKRPKKRRVIEVVILSLLVAVGLAGIFSNQLVPFLYQTIPPKIHRISPNKDGTHTETTLKFEDRPAKEATLQNIISAYNSSKPPAAGYFVIPSVGIHLPIYSGIGYNTMLYGVGEQYPEDTVRAGSIGNYTVASHLDYYTDYLFGKLPSVVVGEKVYVSDSEKVYEYNIDWKTAVDPSEAANYIRSNEGLSDKKRLITIYTCTDMKSSGRWIVRGHVTNEWSLLNAPNNVKDDFQTWINAPY